MQLAVDEGGGPTLSNEIAVMLAQRMVDAADVLTTCAVDEDCGSPAGERDASYAESAEPVDARLAQADEG